MPAKRTTDTTTAKPAPKRVRKAKEQPAAEEKMSVDDTPTLDQAPEEAPTPPPTTKKEIPPPPPTKYERWTEFVQSRPAGEWVGDSVELFESEDIKNITKMVGDEKIGFGKYKDQAYIDVWNLPKKKGQNYLIWVSQQEFCFDDTREIIETLRREFSN